MLHRKSSAENHGSPREARNRWEVLAESPLERSLIELLDQEASFFAGSVGRVILGGEQEAGLERHGSGGE